MLQMKTKRMYVTLGLKLETQGKLSYFVVCITLLFNFFCIVPGAVTNHRYIGNIEAKI